MIHFINVQTKQYPVYEGQIKYEHKIDDALTYPHYELPSEYALVKVAEEPAHNPDTHTVEPVFPTLINGEWTLGWKLRELTAKEIERVALLKKYVEEGRTIDPTTITMLVEIP